jgi:ribonuclease R
MKSPYFSIDDKSTKDIDDAISIEQTKDGWRIRVAIANVAEVIPLGSTEDLNAMRQGATVYQRDQALHPMIPRRYSEGLLSLIAGEPRRILRYRIDLNDACDVVAFAADKRRIKVAQRLTYEEVPTILAQADHPLHTAMSALGNLARVLLAKRRQAGALAFYDLSKLLLSNEEGKVQVIEDPNAVIGHLIIQEMMILSNVALTRWVLERNLPFLYRNHEAKLAAPPSADLAQNIQDLIASGGATADVLQEKIALVATRANYGATLLGHYGLSVPAYSHNTSPIRRYADLANQRQIVAHLMKTELPHTQEAMAAMAEQLNESILQRERERSSAYVGTVRRRAETALSRGTVERLADHELRQLLRFDHPQGQLPADVDAMLCERAARNLVSNSIAGVLLLEIRSTLSSTLAQALTDWLQKYPQQSAVLLHLGLQGKICGETKVTAHIPTGVPDHQIAGNGIFAATAQTRRSCKVEDETVITGHGRGNRRRDAEQRAAFAVMCQLADLPAPSTPWPASQEEKQPAAAGPAPGKSPISILNEMCQSAGAPAPEYLTESSGKPNQASFICTVKLPPSLQIRGVAILEATSDACGSKKAAEAMAAQRLVNKIGADTPTLPPQPIATNDVNVDALDPISELNLWVQRHHLANPIYTYGALGNAGFKATVRVGGHAGEGASSTKQQAKSLAAREAIAVIAQLGNRPAQRS